jgi:hypothetical protein
VDDPIVEMLEDLAGDSAQDETWTCPHDGYVDWHALFIGVMRKHYILHVDNQGFKSYDVYTRKADAYAAWDELVGELDNFYGGEE